MGDRPASLALRNRDRRKAYPPRTSDDARSMAKIPYSRARDPLPAGQRIGSFPDGTGCRVSYRETQPTRRLFPLFRTMTQTKSLLELLSDLATDPLEQAAYSQDPATYLGDHGYSDVTGQEIAEAMGLVAETLPPWAAAGIRPLSIAEGDDGLESAVRQLDHLVDTAGPSNDLFVSDPASTLDSRPADLDLVDGSPFGAGSTSGPALTDAHRPIDAEDIAGFGEGSGLYGGGDPEAVPGESASLAVDSAGAQDFGDSIETSGLVQSLLAEPPADDAGDGVDISTSGEPGEGLGVHDDLGEDDLGDQTLEDHGDADLDAGFF